MLSCTLVQFVLPADVIVEVRVEFEAVTVDVDVDVNDDVDVVTGPFVVVVTFIAVVVEISVDVADVVAVKLHLLQENLQYTLNGMLLRDAVGDVQKPGFTFT